MAILLDCRNFVLQCEQAMQLRPVSSRPSRPARAPMCVRSQQRQEVNRAQPISAQQSQVGLERVLPQCSISQSRTRTSCCLPTSSKLTAASS